MRGTAWMAGVAVCTAVWTAPEAQIASQVLALTGNKAAKVAWSRAVGGITSDYQIVFGSGTYRLMSYSTATDQVTDVLGTTGRYYRVKINYDGSKILYNTNGDLYMVDWSGSNNRLVMRNAALDCYWHNASTGKEYVFVSRGAGGSPTNMAYWDTGDPLWRICLSDTTEKLRITLGFYQGGSTYAGIWLAVSNDGTRLAGHFPWTGGAGGGGMQTVAANGSCTFTSFGVYGCWGMTPPDNTYRYMLYDVDTHNRWAVFNADKSGKHNVNIVPSGTSEGTYCARMSVNDPRFFTLIAPMGESASGFNTSVGIYLGKLDAGITATQGWVKIAGSGECMGCAWIDQGSSPQQPVLAASTAQLAFSATSGGANPASKTVTITNGGSGTLTNVTATSDTSWLTVTRSGTGNSQTLTNQVNIAGLAVGTHTGHVTVSGGGASNTVTYTVTLTLSLDAPVLASIVLTPATDSIGPSERVFLTARCRDQRGNPIKAVVTWTASGGGSLTRAASPAADSTDTTTFVSNGTTGTYRVIAASGTVRDTATVIVTSSLATTITLLAPLGDRNFAIGDTMRVRWTATGIASGVMIHISLDAGLNWATVPQGATEPFTPTSAGWGDYSWRIPATVSVLGAGGAYTDVSTVSTQVLVEVRGYFNEAVAVSPKEFTISQGASTRSRQDAGRGGHGAAIRCLDGWKISVALAEAARVQVHDSRGRCVAHFAAGKAPGAIGLPGPGWYAVSLLRGRQTVVIPVML